MVQQHFTLIPTLTAGENLVLARPESRRLPDRAGCRARVEQLIERFGLPVRTDVPAGELSVGEQQRLELLRALDADARVLLLDEPTAVLTDHEAAHLLVVCRKLADDGRAVAVITHRLGEVFAGCDRVTVLREGREVIGDDPVSAHTRADLATAMIGSIATGKFTERARPQHDAADSQAQGPPRLSVSGLRSGMLAGVDLDLYPGEIVAIAGVDGNGQADLEAALSGRTQPDGGSVQVDGVDMAVSQPRARRGYGVAYILQIDIAGAWSGPWIWPTISNWAEWPRFGEGAGTAGPTPQMRSRHGTSAAPAPRPEPPPCLAATPRSWFWRELDEEPAVVLACYPTRGLDPSAADSVAGKLIERAERGASVLWIGSELDELFAVADRLFVMFDGRFTGPFKPPFDRAAIGLAMAGAELDTDGEMVVDVRDGVGVAEAGS